MYKEGDIVPPQLSLCPEGDRVSFRCVEAAHEVGDKAGGYQLDPKEVRN